MSELFELKLQLKLKKKRSSVTIFADSKKRLKIGVRNRRLSIRSQSIGYSLKESLSNRGMRYTDENQSPSGDRSTNSITIPKTLPLLKSERYFP
tara:strand:+ start:363 stop:644 length:282 start_codon:yes stop_codon:yes gene_type:complete